MLYAVEPSASDVAHAIRVRLPGVSKTKVHKLLYYAQGHHLAAFGRPLFREQISAWDLGPVVGPLWKDEEERGETVPVDELDQGRLNTIGYVLSRYGGLTATDLVRLTHSETPWQRAETDRPAKGRARIERDWTTEFFLRDDVDTDDETGRLDHDEVARWLAGANERRPADGPLDDLDELRTRLHRPA